MATQSVNLRSTIREEIQRAAPQDADRVLKIIMDVLAVSGMDLRREPTLEEMKHFLTDGLRAARQHRSLAC